ncbi:CrcB family protein [Caldicoprobacter algeriensis]|uniref:fluoride efflux transporter FluC n=1 Tax=Caldicoprobacter algeriensis TaxID=699281 RepID=UPI00207ACE9B|nr:CrcB family protein [Caldicoprobacter algeriensis]MCM8901117.1 CrcB family protein [Caldicoprobacter algeriensis]
MKKYIFIGVGGSLGAVLRFIIKAIQINGYKNMPINTLVINAMGSFMLALILTVAFEMCKFDTHIHLGITTGLLGAFTTFSTLCKETVELMRQGFYILAVTYMAISAVLGFAAVYSGVYLVRKVAPVILKNRSNSTLKQGEIN